LIQSIENIIPEKNIVFFSPHYDDFLFVLGGYVQSLKDTNNLAAKNFDILLIFSRSNYQVKEAEKNFDNSDPRIKFATGNRLIEDLNCIDELLGQGSYTYSLWGEKECFVRGKKQSQDRMEFPHGMYDDFEEADWQIYRRAIKKIRHFADKEDTALVFPLAIKEHIDHFIIREAAAEVLQSGKTKAKFYFHEDKPYGGLADETELARTEDFIMRHNLHSKFYVFEPQKMIDLAFKHYISQVEEVYKVGILKRAEFWKEDFGQNVHIDRICCL
jgi:hypothetical protein